MINFAEVLISALEQLINQLATLLPKLIIALLIWWIGKYLLNLGVKLIKRLDIKGTKLDNRAIEFLGKSVVFLGKILLVLIILDYLGIGRTVIGAFMNGLTLAIAIALGIAFGKALEKDASQLVAQVRNQLKK